MKKKVSSIIALAAVLCGAFLFAARGPRPNSTGQKVLYYTCAMHPWVRESKPGPCPVCGMNLTPIYANESAAASGTNSDPGLVALEPESVTVINVQMDPVEHRAVRRTLHLAGEITGNSATAAWFEFTVYERDLPWLKTGQSLAITVTAAPDKIYTAQIKPDGAKPFADADFDMMTGSTKVRAEISNPPVEAGDFGRHKFFSGLHAEAHLAAETEAVLAVLRSAVISRGTGAMVYVDQGSHRYAPRAVRLGRIGDEYCEVLAGLKEGEKVVTTGNVLIDSEAQLGEGQ